MQRTCGSRSHKSGSWSHKSLIVQIFGGWIATLIVAGVSAGLMTAILVYTPNKNMADDRVYANKQLNAETLTMINQAGGATGPLGVGTLFHLTWILFYFVPS